MSKKSVGRPVVFADKPAVRKAIAKLIKSHGLTGTQVILSNGSKKNRAIRKEAGVPTWTTCNLVTLSRIKNEFGIELKVGRPALAA